MNDKLRLLVTDLCFGGCEKCCNKQYDLTKLPVVGDIMQYKEISITGGEPLLFEKRLNALVMGIKMLNPNVKLYLYTALTPYFSDELQMLDGITYTLHSDKQFGDFAFFNMHMRKYPSLCFFKSLRLNIFKEVQLPDYSLCSYEDLWEVIKIIEWQDKCPVPAGEDFMRLNELWR